MNRELNNPEEFYQIHQSGSQFQEAVSKESNISMRFVLISHGFKGSRANAQTLLDLAKNDTEA